MSVLSDLLAGEDSPSGQLRILRAHTGLPYGVLLNRYCDLLKRGTTDETMGDLLVSGVVSESDWPASLPDAA